MNKYQRKGWIMAIILLISYILLLIIELEYNINGLGLCYAIGTAYGYIIGTYASKEKC